MQPQATWACDRAIAAPPYCGAESDTGRNRRGGHCELVRRSVHGRPAADGEIYDMEKLVAAHRTMPFNTWLKVTNLKNGLSVDVRVIDRGPFVANRIIDLSKAAARQIQMLGPGIARVRIEVVSAPIDLPGNDFYAVQVGAFANYANASRVRARYAARYGTAQIALKQGKVPLYRVLVGREPSPQAAQQLAAQLRTGREELFIVRLDKNPSCDPSSGRRKRH